MHLPLTEQNQAMSKKPTMIQRKLHKAETCAILISEVIREVLTGKVSGEISDDCSLEILLVCRVYPTNSCGGFGPELEKRLEPPSRKVPDDIHFL